MQKIRELTLTWPKIRLLIIGSIVLVVMLISVCVNLFAKKLAPEGITDNLLLNTLYAAMVGGMSYGFVFRGLGTSGETRILGRALQLKAGIPISQVCLLIDDMVVVTAGLVFGWKLALYACSPHTCGGLSATRFWEDRV